MEEEIEEDEISFEVSPEDKRKASRGKVLASGRLRRNNGWVPEEEDQGGDVVEEDILLDEEEVDDGHRGGGNGISSNRRHQADDNDGSGGVWGQRRDARGRASSRAGVRVSKDLSVHRIGQDDGAAETSSHGGAGGEGGDRGGDGGGGAAGRSKWQDRFNARLLKRGQGGVRSQSPSESKMLEAKVVVVGQEDEEEEAAPPPLDMYSARPVTRGNVRLGGEVRGGKVHERAGLETPPLSRSQSPMGARRSAGMAVSPSLGPMSMSRAGSSSTSTTVLPSLGTPSTSRNASPSLGGRPVSGSRESREKGVGAVANYLRSSRDGGHEYEGGLGVDGAHRHAPSAMRAGPRDCFAGGGGSRDSSRMPSPDLHWDEAMRDGPAEAEALKRRASRDGRGRGGGGKGWRASRLQ